MCKKLIFLRLPLASLTALRRRRLAAALDNVSKRITVNKDRRGLDCKQLASQFIDFFFPVGFFVLGQGRHIRQGFRQGRIPVPA